MIEFWAIKLTLPCCASMQEENLAAGVREHDEVILAVSVI